MPAELLSDVGLGIDRSAERAHRDFEFPAAECTDCNHRRRAKPLDDFKIALLRRVVLLYHRTERPQVSGNTLFRCQVLLVGTIVLIASQCFLTTAMARAIVVRWNLIIF
jgi:hypothetical protein